MRICLLKLIVLTVCCTILFHHNSEAYENKITHRYINEKAVKEISGVNKILRSSLRFDDGIREIIGEKKVWEWIRDGGKEEDEPPWRCFRHFHDPLKNWDDAGLLSVYKSIIY